MTELYFSKKYFKEKIVDDPKSKVRVTINENPSFSIAEEEYSLRVTTRYENPATIHRDYAIEHHTDPPHDFPHLQFKFHTEEIGQFRMRIDIASHEEYKRAIQGFIYKIKEILEDVERFKQGITNEMLVLELVNELKSDSRFLDQKIKESIKKYLPEFDKGVSKDKIERLGKNPLLIAFMGKENTKLIQENSKV